MSWYGGGCGIWLWMLELPEVLTAEGEYYTIFLAWPPFVSFNSTPLSNWVQFDFAHASLLVLDLFINPLTLLWVLTQLLELLTWHCCLSSKSLRLRIHNGCELLIFLSQLCLMSNLAPRQETLVLYGFYYVMNLIYLTTELCQNLSASTQFVDWICIIFLNFSSAVYQEQPTYEQRGCVTSLPCSSIHTTLPGDVEKTSYQW